jgi:hypothetical protein
MSGTTAERHAGCSKRPFSKAAGESKPEAYPRGYVEDFDEPRTTLADFFSILLVRLLGTVEPDAKLDRTMVRFAAATGAGDLGFPVCGFVVESAGCLSALGDGGPGFVGPRDIGHEATDGKGDVTDLRSLSLRHTETTRLFCRGVRIVHRLRVSCFQMAPQAYEHE